MGGPGFGKRQSVPSVGVSKDGQARLTSRPTVGQFGRSRQQRAKDPTGGFLHTIVSFFRRAPS